MVTEADLKKKCKALGFGETSWALSYVLRARTRLEEATEDQYDIVLDVYIADMEYKATSEFVKETHIMLKYLLQPHLDAREVRKEIKETIED